VSPMGSRREDHTEVTRPARMGWPFSLRISETTLGYRFLRVPSHACGFTLTSWRHGPFSG
jgi:hypothetical protein